MLPTFTLFSPPFSECFTTGAADPETLWPEEQELIRESGTKRIRDFSTGRFCARKALAAFNQHDAKILRGHGKEPLWPEGITGSISHSENLTGAIVARKEEISAVGLDIEKAGAITREMWYLLFTPAETAFLNACEPATSGLFTSLLFSMKESFYKLQYPFTRQFLEFKEAEISLTDGVFRVAVNKPGYTLPFSLAEVDINWQHYEQEVITLCYRVSSRVPG